MKILFAGTPQFSVSCLSALIRSDDSIVGVLTQPDRPSGRGHHIQFGPIKQLALDHQLPVFQPEQLKTPEVRDLIAQLNPDVIVVVAYGLILPSSLLKLPRFGCINVHASILPRWRGASPIQYAILSGDAESGVTTIQMDAGMDTGAMLLKKICPILSTDTAQTLGERLSHWGAEVLLDTLRTLKRGALTAISQDNQFATYAPKIEKSQAQIKWNVSVIEIDRLIRAFNPWPIAYTQLMGKTIRVWDAHVIDPECTAQEGGVIVQACDEGLDVATAKGILRITKLQLPGGKALPFKQVYQGHRDLFAVKNRFE